MPPSSDGLAAADHSPDDRGFLLAATGPRYRRALVKALRSVRAHHPDIAIDVYVDEPMDLPEASRVIVLPDGIPTARPRFHILRETRFKRCILLDVDLFVLAPLGDIFDVLERFDVAAAHEIFRNGALGRTLWQEKIPAAFPQVNGGVLGFNRSPAVLEAINAWEAGYLAHDIKRDQPALREVLWNRPDLRLAILPEEYNFWDARRIDRLTDDCAAPRILHNNTFTLTDVIDMDGGEIEALLGHARVARLATLIRGDEALAEAAGRLARRGGGRGAFLRGYLRDLPRKARAAIRRVLKR